MTRHPKDSDRNLLNDLARMPIVSESDPIFNAKGDRILNLLERREEQRLTKKELHCIILLSHGWEHRKISHELGISYDQVRERLKHARIVMQANNNAQLIGNCVRAGIVD